MLLLTGINMKKKQKKFLCNCLKLSHFLINQIFLGGFGYVGEEGRLSTDLKSFLLRPVRLNDPLHGSCLNPRPATGGGDVAIAPSQPSGVPGFPVFSSAAAARQPAAFAFGQSGEGGQVRAGSGQVGTATLLLLLLAAAFCTAASYPVGPHQHAVARVTVEIVLPAH